MEPEVKQENGRENTEPQPLTPKRLRLSRLGRLGAFPGPEIYEPEEDAAHPRLPLGSMVSVQRRETNRSRSQRE